MSTHYIYSHPTNSRIGSRSQAPKTSPQARCNAGAARWRRKVTRPLQRLFHRPLQRLFHRPLLRPLQRLFHRPFQRLFHRPLLRPLRCRSKPLHSGQEHGRRPREQRRARRSTQSCRQYPAASRSCKSGVALGSVQFFLRDANGVVWLTEVQAAYVPHHYFV